MYKNTTAIILSYLKLNSDFPQTSKLIDILNILIYQSSTLNQRMCFITCSEYFCQQKNE